jgi:hypothetical protein
MKIPVYGFGLATLLLVAGIVVYQVLIAVVPFLRSRCRLQRINALRNRGSSMQVDR